MWWQNLPFFTPEFWIDRYSDWDRWRYPSEWSLDLFVNTFLDGLVIAAVGWTVAWMLERRHLKKLAAREAEVAHITALPTPHFDDPGTQDTDFLISSAAYCHDFFRSFVIFIRRMFGGHVSAYQRLLDRARREAMVRLKEEAAVRGVTTIYAVRLEENNLSRNFPRIEVMAYGTAYK